MLIRIILAAALPMFLLFADVRSLHAQPSEVSYQGELKKDGLPFTGTAQMKFVIVDGGGESIWSNDGTSVNGSQPTDFVSIETENGIFAVRLGAAPMEPISGGLLKGITEVALRVWVNTGGGFEQLTDQPISSSAFSLSGEKCLEIGDLQINVVPRWDGTALVPGVLFDNGSNVGVGTDTPATKLDVSGTVRSSAGGFQFPDGTTQTTAVTGGGGGVPSGAMILTDSEFAPQGYAFTGLRSLVSTVSAWTPRANMPAPWRNTTVSCAVNGKIYVMGGIEEGFVSSTVGIYDPELDSWTSGPPMLIERENFAAASVGTKIYVMGGQNNNNGNLNTIDELDTLTGEWTTKAPMPTGRRWLAAASVEGKVYAIGGHFQSEVLRTVEEYDPSTNSWTASADLPAEKADCAAVDWGGLIFVIGGNSPSVFAFDPQSNSWSTRQSTPSYNITRAAVLGGRVFAHSHAVVSFASYDPALDYWTIETPTTVASNFSAASVGNQFFLFGNAGSPSTLAFTLPTTLYVHEKQ